jgi:hypothetical protein
MERESPARFPSVGVSDETETAPLRWAWRRLHRLTAHRSFARRYPDPNPGANPYEQDNQNPFPMLDVWPTSPSIGRARRQSVTGTLAFAKPSFARAGHGHTGRVSRPD